MSFQRPLHKETREKGEAMIKRDRQGYVQTDEKAAHLIVSVATLKKKASEGRTQPREIR